MYESNGIAGAEEKDLAVTNENNWVQPLNLRFSQIYALTGDDMRLIFTHQPADPAQTLLQF